MTKPAPVEFCTPCQGTGSIVWADGPKKFVPWSPLDGQVNRRTCTHCAGKGWVERLDLTKGGGVCSVT